MYATSKDINRMYRETVSREELVARIERAVAPQDVARLDRAEGDKLEARWIIGKPRL